MGRAGRKGRAKEEVKLPDAARERILRLRSVMPEESTIDLDEHAALVAYEIERTREESIEKPKTHVLASREYLQEVHRFLADVRPRREP